MTSAFLWYFILQMHQQILSALHLHRIQTLITSHQHHCHHSDPSCHYFIPGLLHYPNLIFPLSPFLLTVHFPHSCRSDPITWEWLCHSSIQSPSVATHLPQSMGWHVCTVPARPHGSQPMTSQTPFLPLTPFQPPWSTYLSSNRQNSILNQGFSLFCLFVCFEKEFPIDVYMDLFLSSFRSLLEFI